MNRSALAFATIGWLTAAAVHPQTFYRDLIFDIDLTIKDGDLYSPATVTCIDWQGRDDFDCPINGEHFIFDAWDNVQIGYRAYQTVYQYNNYVRRAPINDGADHCYRARVTGYITGTSYFKYLTTFQKCTLKEPIDTHPGCPILVDLDTDGFHLSGIEDAVSFDLNADGVAEQLAWTAEGEGDGFLCRDRNGNGTIDDGRELFGQETPLATGERAQVAYTALAELDQPELGGNSDGFVGAEDAVFQDLCVWVDGNHDAISQPGEVSSLSEAGIVRLGYNFLESRHRDAHDNLFRYKSQGWIVGPGGRPRVTNLYDVFFRVP